MNLTPGDSSRSSHRISWPASDGERVEALGDLDDLRVLVGAQRHEVRGVRRDLGRPDDALLVVVFLDDAGDVPPDADAVRAHDDGPRDAVLGEVRGPGGDRVPRPELEDVADLDPVAQDDRLAAGGARIAFLGVGEVRDDVGGEVAPGVDVAVVEALAVRARRPGWPRRPPPCR